MLAYCTALSVPTAWLIYAGGGDAHRRRIRNSKIEVIEYPLDLRREPAALLQQIDRLANRAWRRADALVPFAA